MSFNHAQKELCRLIFFVMRRRGVNNARFKHLARAVNNGDLAAGAISRVKSHSHLVFNRRLHKQGL